MIQIHTQMRYESAARCGARIRYLRAVHGWSQAELARRAGFSQQQIGKVELGETNTPIDTLRRIAEALGVPVVDLFVDERGEPLFMEHGTDGISRRLLEIVLSVLREAAEDDDLSRTFGDVLKRIEMRRQMVDGVQSMHS